MHIVRVFQALRRTFHSFQPLPTRTSCFPSFPLAKGTLCSRQADRPCHEIQAGLCYGDQALRGFKRTREPIRHSSGSFLLLNAKQHPFWRFLAVSIQVASTNRYFGNGFSPGRWFPPIYISSAPSQTILLFAFLFTFQKTRHSHSKLSVSSLTMMVNSTHLLHQTWTPTAPVVATLSGKTF